MSNCVISGMEDYKPATDAFDRIVGAYSVVLDALYEGTDTDWKTDSNFKETPKRIARSMLNERCMSIQHTDKIKQLLDKRFETDYRGMIVYNNPITLDSLCPHHFMNVQYDVYAARAVYKSSC